MENRLELYVPTLDDLSLLLEHAFEKLGAKAVHNDFEDARDAAVRTHLACGFQEYKRENGIIELLITKETYKSSAAPVAM